MLWTKIASLTTPDGATKVGVDVRQWLKDKQVLAGDYAADDFVLETRDQVKLRTPGEFRVWFEEVQGCKNVTFTPEPVPVPPPVDVGARGDVHQVVDEPMRIKFVEGITNDTVSRVNVQQGKSCNVRVYLSPALTNAQGLTFELAWVGAKVGIRPATRSVKDPTSGYQYLSRVRVTRHSDGIQSVDNALLAGPTRPVVPTVEEAGIEMILEAITLTGLEAEHGTEILHACILSQNGAKVECWTTLEVTVAPATGVGAFQILQLTDGNAFKTATDDWFDAIHALAPNAGDAVRVGVVDSGVHDDANELAYLSPRWISGKFFDTAEPNVVRALVDRPTKAVDPHPKHIMEDSPSKHGTNVAGNAAWGTNKIKIVDVMVQRGQMAGAMVDATAERAFAWAREQTCSVINCSKVLPFSGDLTHAVVSHATSIDAMLFVATGGNKNFSFPLNFTQLGQIGSDLTRGDLPRSLKNTLWVGGCRGNFTPHPSRGHGPGVEVMVPSSEFTALYTPKQLVRWYRGTQILKFRADVLEQLRVAIEQLGNPPATVQGQLSLVERSQFANLESRENDPQFPQRDRERLQLLRAKQLNAPNPVYAKLQGLTAGRQAINGWAHDDPYAWMGVFNTALSKLSRQDTVAEAPAGLTALTDTQRQPLYDLLRQRYNTMDVGPGYTELHNANVNDNHVSTDDGVSFGLPIVSNIAAKLKLINRNLTANQIKRILIDTSDRTPKFESLCMAQGIINPLRAYFAAYDNLVSTGGTDPHEFAPVTKPEIDETRRIYVTYFCMGAEGSRLYAALKDQLRAEYHKANIDVVEAEPPISIPEESITYVAGLALGRHNWKTIVPTHHPLTKAPKHLRIVLLNECAFVMGNVMSGQCCPITLDAAAPVAALRNAPQVWTPAVDPNANDPLRKRKVNITAAAYTPALAPTTGTFRLQFTLDAPTRLPDRDDHVVVKFKITGAAERTLQLGTDFTLTRDGVRGGTIDIAAAGPLFEPQPMAVEIDIAVIQTIGGSRDERTVFVSGKYHAGPSGSAQANRSTLVLLQHEIGHALGMVPSTHSQYYNNQYGGEGDHCATNAQNKTNLEAVPLGVKGDGVSGNVKVPNLLVTNDPIADNNVPCVMYHTRSRVHHASLFCAECLQLLSGDSLKPKWSWPRG